MAAWGLGAGISNFFLSEKVSAKSGELQPVARRVSFTPSLTSIGGLLLRLGQSMEAQRRFVADAAHGLRSPLTALSLQAEALDRDNLSPQSRATVARLRQGMARARSLIDQLLVFVRSQAQPELPWRRAQPCAPSSKT